MKKCLSLLLALSLAVLPLTACGSASAASNGEVVVYNWGEYIDPETISMFEEETELRQHSQCEKKYRRTVLGTVKAVRSGEQIFRTLLLGNRWNSVQ